MGYVKMVKEDIEEGRATYLELIMGRICSSRRDLMRRLAIRFREVWKVHLPFPCGSPLVALCDPAQRERWAKSSKKPPAKDLL
jgi:hypothetical protein